MAGSFAPARTPARCSNGRSPSAEASPLLPRPAPGPEHRPRDGYPARRDVCLGSQAANGRDTPKPRSGRAGSCSGRGIARSTRCSSRPHVAQMRAAVPGDQGAGASGVHDVGGRHGRPGRLDRVHPEDGRRGARGLDSGRSAPSCIWSIDWPRSIPTRRCYFLSPMVCMCATMYRIDLPHLAWTLENLVQGTPVNIIKVPEETANSARGP